MKKTKIYADLVNQFPVFLAMDWARHAVHLLPEDIEQLMLILSSHVLDYGKLGSEGEKNLLESFIEIADKISLARAQGTKKTILNLSNEEERKVEVAAASALIELRHESPEALLVLLAALSDDGNSNVCMDAIATLDQLKSDNPQVISALLTVLRNAGRKGRKAAAKALWRLQPDNPDNPEVVSIFLVWQREIDSPGGSDITYRNLIRWMSENPQVISAFLAVLMGKDEYVHDVAIAVLRQPQFTDEKWWQFYGFSCFSASWSVEDVEDYVRDLAAEALLRLSSGEVLGNFYEWRHSAVNMLREKVETLRQLQSDSTHILSAFRASLQDKDRWARIVAAYTLEQWKSDNPELIPALLTALEDKDEWIRIAAARSFGRLKSDSPQIISVLLTALEDGNECVRCAAARALGRLKSNSPQVISALLTALRDQYGFVREVAADALGQWQSDNPTVISLLLAVPKVEHEFAYRAAVAKALKKWKPNNPEVISGVLRDRLKDKDVFVRIAVAQALGQLQPGNSKVIRVLKTALKDKNGVVRIAAAHALGQLQPGNAKAISVLWAALKDKDWRVREAAADALEQWQSDDPQIISVFLAKLKDEDKEVRGTASQALKQWKSDNSGVILALLAALRDEDEYVRSTAAHALGRCQSGNLQIISALQNVFKDNEYTRIAAALRVEKALVINFAKKIVNIQSKDAADKQPVPANESFRYADPNVVLGECILKGGFSQVFRGAYQKNVAIKRLKFDHFSENAKKEFENEVTMMTVLRAPWVITFYGFFYRENRYHLVMEYMENGSLYHVLSDSEKFPLPWESQRYQIALDVAMGVEFLHSKHIIHRDLKSLNVLLDTQLHAKLADFGLAQIKRETEILSKRGSTESKRNQPKALLGTLRWMAPELFGLEPIYGFPSDLFAFAIVLWELATRRIPFPEAKDAEIKDSIKNGTYTQELVNELDEHQENTCPKTIIELMQHCWQQKPQERYNPSEAVTYLKQHGVFAAKIPASLEKSESTADDNPEATESFDIKLKTAPDRITPENFKK